ncbi:c-type cytochrome [Methylocaldum sp.]|uniref:c-type cytochrome n=1 Tax=Methylocaldum sp. TaxID=1969727 RepID=UPI002D6FD827|nr:c-type cytochrome [Methylocaldum sp.]HYE34089.1 c-type cytochrome [Methylocaldum sp.]
MEIVDKFSALANPIAVLLLLIGCEREERRFREPPPAASAIESIRLSDLQPGTPTPVPAIANPYEANAYALAEGKRLFSWYNCVGCHFHGGGGIGPPLMDDEWIYGGEPQNIFATIIQGRPNGMPAFGGSIPVAIGLIGWFWPKPGEAEKDLPLEKPP